MDEKRTGRTLHYLIKRRKKLCFKCGKKAEEKTFLNATESLSALRGVQ